MIRPLRHKQVRANASLAPYCERRRAEKQRNSRRHGSAALGSCNNAGGGFDVTGGHTYAHAGGKDKTFQAVTRIDTPYEIHYYRHGGILQYVLRQLIG